MKNQLTGVLVGTIMGLGSASAAVLANFDGSIDETSPATPANLNNGTTGGTWSGIVTTDNDGDADVSVVGETLRMGDADNASNVSNGAISSATLNFSAQPIAGTTFSFDAILNGYGGQVGQIYFDLFDGTTQILRVSMSPDSGMGRGTLNHWSAVGGTRTGLTAENKVWSGTGQDVGVEFTLDSGDFDLITTGGADLDVASTDLAYFSGFSSTTFDSLVITAEGNKAAVTLDNIKITAIPEPSSAALLGLGGVALILRRKK